MSQFDFSEFHPLDHHILEPYCWGWAGGIPRHIKLWWAYQVNFRWPWQTYLAKRSCDKGIHHAIPYWTSLSKATPKQWSDGFPMGPADGLQCRDCDWHREA